MSGMPHQETPNMTPIDPTLFYDTLLRETRQAWATLKKKHPQENFYAFGYYTTDVASYLTITASTEEGLEIAVDEYHGRTGEDKDLLRARLRWIPADSPLHVEGDALLPLSQGMRCAGPDPYKDDEAISEPAIELVFKSMFDVLQTLDQEGLFGAGQQREQLILCVWMGDQSDQQRFEFAQRLNSESAALKFSAEMEEGWRS
jgi:Domain of unknown function (DUF4303)